MLLLLAPLAVVAGGLVWHCGGGRGRPRGPATPRHAPLRARPVGPGHAPRKCTFERLPARSSRVHWSRIRFHILIRLLSWPLPPSLGPPAVGPALSRCRPSPRPRECVEWGTTLLGCLRVPARECAAHPLSCVNDTPRSACAVRPATAHRGDRFSSFFSRSPIHYTGLEAPPRGPAVTLPAWLLGLAALWLRAPCLAARRGPALWQGRSNWNVPPPPVHPCGPGKHRLAPPRPRAFQ